MSLDSKIVGLDSVGSALKAARAHGQIIAQCHGTFDLLYPGQIEFLQAARAQADFLVVTLTSENHLSGATERPFFSDELRARTLAALQCVDRVVIVPFAGASEAIEVIRPNLYCLPKSYEPGAALADLAITEEVRAAEAVGAKVAYVGEAHYSSPRVFIQQIDHVDAPVREFSRTLAQGISAAEMRAAVEAFSDLKVLIIGDTIFDRYSFVKVQGLTSKNRIISGRFLREETHSGGALAVFRHVKQFVKEVRFLSLVGSEPWVEPLLSEHVGPLQDLILREPSFTTVIKQRFVEPLGKGKELSKLFSVNYIEAEPPSEKVQALLKERIADQIQGVDLALVLDFGHGLFQPAIRDLVQDAAPFLALNCQTNSNNHGFNIISRQYERADAFSLDEQEILLACGRRHVDFPVELGQLQSRLKARYAWLTRGPVQTIGLRESAPPCFCPPFENDVVDTIGAGDAFFSVASLAAARGLPIDLATFLGQLAGAQAVKIVGNARPISKQTLIETGAALLSC